MADKRLTFVLFFLFLFSSLFIIDNSYAKDITLFSFESDPEGWEIPDWALTKDNYVAGEVSISQVQASEGVNSLEIGVNFPSDPQWTGAYIERVIDITDWSPFRYLSVDVCLPKDAPQGLRARIILTIGENWKWSESNKAFALTPGEWAVIKLDLTSDSKNWRKYLTDDFRADVRKIGLRIESNGKIAYRGPVYIDNVRLLEQ